MDYGGGNYHSQKPITVEEMCMIRDSVDQDLHSGINTGIGTTSLVQTGEYQRGNKTKTNKAITNICRSIVEANNYVLKLNKYGLEN